MNNPGPIVCRVMKVMTFTPFPTKPSKQRPIQGTIALPAIESHIPLPFPQHFELAQISGVIKLTSGAERSETPSEKGSSNLS